MKKASRRRIDVNVDELDRIIDAAMQAPLNEADGRTLKTAVHAMAERLVRRRNTEKTGAVLEPKAPPAAVDTPEPEKQAPAGHGRNGADAFTGADRIAIAHATLQSGDSCPGCREGRVYRQKEPATLIRITGQAPLKATVFEMERLRCNACGEVFTASQPQSAGAEKFDATAVVMIALLKYGTGMPFNRMERLEGQLGIPLPATTQWELMAAFAKLLRPLLEELIRQAAQGGVMHNDDNSADGARRGRRTHGNFHQRHRIDLRRAEDRAVLQRMEACGRKPRRCPEAPRARAGSADPDVRRVIAEFAEADGNRTYAGQLPHAREAAVYGSRGELSRRVPVCAGVFGSGVRLRR